MLTTIAFVPQVWRIVKLRHTKDLSLVMYLVFGTGVGCWLAYGVALGAWPIMIANSITLVLVVLIILLKLRWG